MILNKNLKAFLDMIAWSEGTDNGKQPTNDHGYDVLVGGGLFQNYADHPRRSIQLNRSLRSTAAGRYQILQRYFDSYKNKLALKDFSPGSQDAIAVQMIKEQKALDAIQAGRLDDAIEKCNDIWASLAGSRYGQHTWNLDTLKKIYLQKGGTLS